MALVSHTGSDASNPAAGPRPPAPPQPATAQDVPRLAASLADAFMSDPVYTWMVPGRVRLRTRLRAMFTAELEQYVLANGGSVWTTAGRDGAVCALPPGGWEFPRSATGRQALQWVWAFGTRVGVATRVQRAMEERHPHEPHVYVRIVGVRAAWQGRGIGSALMGPVLVGADAAGVPTYLEASTERSASLYARLGFVALDRLDLPDGGPPLWPMRRPAPAER